MQKNYDPIFKRGNPHIIHAHTLFSDGSLANHYFEAYGTPFIVAVRSTDIDYFLKYKPWLKGYGKRVLRNADQIVFISHSLKVKFNRHYGSQFESKSIIIPNGINQHYLSFSTPAKKQTQSPLELLYVGNFRKIKNVPLLINIAERLNANLTIVGGGGNGHRKALKMIKNADHVNYLGHITDQTILREIYQNSDIFIMISKTETLGLVYLEAMSQGLPVIYTTNTGIYGLFEEGQVGFGIDLKSYSDIENAVAKILHNYPSISNSCKEMAMAFTWDKISNRTFQAYKKCLT